MAFKAVLLLLSTLLLFGTSVSSASDEKEYLIEKDTNLNTPVPAPPVPPTAPIKPPTATPPTPVMPPTTTPSTPVKPPTATPAPPVKPPTTIPPPVSPPETVPAPKVPSPPASPPPMPIVRTRQDCNPLCAARCKVHSRPNICARACTTCCYRCKCVPPGTYGNREMCGRCYTEMTSRGKPKCP